MIPTVPQPQPEKRTNRIFDWLHKKIHFSSWAAEKFKGVDVDILEKQLKNKGFKLIENEDGSRTYIDPNDDKKSITVRYKGMLL